MDVPFWIWAVTVAAIVGMLVFDFVGHVRTPHAPTLRESATWSVVYISIALAFAAISRRETVRFTLIATALVVSMVIAWSRVWLGVHWPSDVIAGWLGGAGWAFLASALLFRPAQVAVAAVSEAGDSHPAS